MPLQDDYLNDLLNELTDNLDEPDLFDEEAALADDIADDVADGVVDILSEAGDAVSAEDTSSGALDDLDLMSLLGGSDEADLQEIHDLLQKADNNELIEPGVSEEDVLAAGVLGALAGADAVQGEASDLNKADAKAERKRIAEEKKQEREAKKEAAKAAKAAQKEEKRLEREAKKEAAKAEKAAKKAAKKAQKATKADNSSAEDGAVDFDKVTDAEGIDVGLHGADATDDIFADLALLDILGEDAIPEKGSTPVASDNAGEDSLEQIMDKHKKQNKKGVFARIAAFLTEEDEDENEAVQLSDENRDILKAMKKEDKKKKKKNLKKAKNAEGTEAEGEEGEETDGKGKKGKKPKKEKKEKKPKKEKAPKLEDVEDAPKKKLSKKRIMAITGVCLSLAVIIILITSLLGEYGVKQAGKKAYYNGDYQTCYQNLYGKELTESEQVMYNKSESILRIRLWIREYEMFAEQGMELEALDSLIQSVYDYPTLYSFASQWNASSEVEEGYKKILSILSEKYTLTEAQALEIANEPKDVVYTKMVMAIVAGEAYGSWVGTDEIVILPDELPEEAGLGDTEFVDNNPGK